MRTPGQLSCSARIGRLEVLHAVAGEVVVPEAVFHELTVRGAGKAGAQEVERAEWIRLRAVPESSLGGSFPSALSRGQSEAILLAQELGLTLVIDELAGRQEAARRGVQVRGSLGILAEAKRGGFLQEVGPVVKQMRETGYWLNDAMVQDFLEALGERQG